MSLHLEQDNSGTPVEVQVDVIEMKPMDSGLIAVNAEGLGANTELSQRRADAVSKVLTAKYGVAPARLQAAGDGPTAPVASNDSGEGRAKKRRVELVKQ